MTDIDSARRDPPTDWREKLIGVLTADGISELPKVPRWKRFFIVLGKAVGWVLVAFFINLAIVLVAIWIAAYPIYVLYPHDQFDSHMNKVVTVSGWAAFIFVVWFVFPRLRRILREAVPVSLGYQPTDVLKRAKHAPVLFLRSFKFDSITSSVPTWQERLPIGTFAMPTSELNLVQMIFRHAPVIAIGRPGEFTPPNARYASMLARTCGNRLSKPSSRCAS